MALAGQSWDASSESAHVGCAVPFFPCTHQSGVRATLQGGQDLGEVTPLPKAPLKGADCQGLSADSLPSSWDTKPLLLPEDWPGGTLQR